MEAKVECYTCRGTLWCLTNTPSVFQYSGWQALGIFVVFCFVLCLGVPRRYLRLFADALLLLLFLWLRGFLQGLCFFCFGSLFFSVVSTFTALLIFLSWSSCTTAALLVIVVLSLEGVLAGVWSCSTFLSSCTISWNQTSCMTLPYDAKKWGTLGELIEDIKIQYYTITEMKVKLMNTPDWSVG